ncbi:hypothetical protein [Leptolinea tardivitalis]|uniref:N-acetyltransferase domain-containing protein n=2 Tax=Leptolinea tardivitalis TaxID=229920 RepID=A0A0P6X6X7_9CHLR|nr:hypothetical protein [Leptolinea tardivitalis]KPL75125.1 hypothetical protein ADM99_00460 [Leptolinea tardivitalis]
MGLDSALMLTRGNPLGLAAIFAQLHPMRGSYTNVSPSEDGAPPLFGQVNYQQGERSARVAFVAPEMESNLTALPTLLEDLARQSGEWGAYHLLAEIDESSPAFEAFRKAGFSVFAWQRIWKLPVENPDSQPDPDWNPARFDQQGSIQSLFQSLIPPLVLSAEPVPVNGFQGLACQQNDEITAYSDVDFGPSGIYLKPVFHPDAVDVDCLIRALASVLPNPSSRPVYLAIRSYQSWLENGLQKIGAEAAPRQALLVKHLIARQRSPILERGLKALEQRRAEPSSPMARVESRGKS